MIGKRLIDILLSAGALVVASPPLALAMMLIWAQDGRAPLYRSIRVGRGGRDFPMLKLRTMTPDAELKGAASTTRSDARITPLGRALRRWKLDELPQFLNVLAGDMSVVGPRPNTRRGGVDHYTPEEMRLLSVRPGITDLASIVFSDEGDILEGAADPDALYDRVIRPWKSRLGLLYLDHRSQTLDLAIVWLTALAIVARPAALAGVDDILARWGAAQDLRTACRRRSPLPPPRDSHISGLVGDAFLLLPCREDDGGGGPPKVVEGASPSHEPLVGEGGTGSPHLSEHGARPLHRSAVPLPHALRHGGGEKSGRPA